MTCGVGSEPNAPDISVLISYYNNKAYFQQTLRSALGQRGVSREIVVINDASTDGGIGIARWLAAVHPEIRIVENPRNLGVAASRNAGFAAARGRYVHMLDSDDIYPKGDVLARIVAAADAAGSDITVGQFLRWYEDGRLVPPHVAPKARPGLLRIETAPDLALATMGGSCLIRRSFFERAGLRFFEDLRNRDDVPVLTQIMLLSARVQVADIDLLHYRQHTQSMTQSRRWEAFESCTRSIEYELAIRAAHADRLAGAAEFLWYRAEKDLTVFFFKWSWFVLQALGAERAAPSETQAARRALAERFLRAMHALTCQAGPIAVSPTPRLPLNPNQPYDIARLCLEAPGYGALIDLLEGRALGPDVLAQLAKRSEFAWAGQAVAEYQTTLKT